MTHCSALATQHDWRARVRVPLQLRLPPSRLRHRSPAARPAAGSRLLHGASCEPPPTAGPAFVQRQPCLRVQRVQRLLTFHQRLRAFHQRLRAFRRHLRVCPSASSDVSSASSDVSSAPSGVSLCVSCPIASSFLDSTSGSTAYRRRSPSRHRPVPVTPPRPHTSPPRDRATPMPRRHCPSDCPAYRSGRIRARLRHFGSS